MSSPINARYHRDRTIRAGKTKLAGWSPKAVAQLLARQGKGMPAAVAVAQQPSCIELVLVGARLSVGGWGGVDGEWQVQKGGFENPLRREQGHSLAFEREPRM